MKSENLKDWKNTPIYKSEIEGETQMDSIIQQVPESEIVRLAN